MQQVSNGGILHWMIVPLSPLTYFSSIFSAVLSSPIFLRAVTMCLQEAPGLPFNQKTNTSTLRRSISTGCWLSIWLSWAGWRPNFIPSWCQLTKLSSEERFLTFSAPEIWVGHSNKQLTFLCKRHRSNELKLTAIKDSKFACTWIRILDTRLTGHCSEGT